MFRTISIKLLALCGSLSLGIAHESVALRLHKQSGATTVQEYGETQPGNSDNDLDIWEKKGPKFQRVFKDDIFASKKKARVSPILRKPECSTWKKVGWFILVVGVVCFLVWIGKSLVEACDNDGNDEDEQSNSKRHSYQTPGQEGQSQSNPGAGAQPPRDVWCPDCQCGACPDGKMKTGAFDMKWFSNPAEEFQIGGEQMEALHNHMQTNENEHIHKWSPSEGAPHYEVSRAQETLIQWGQYNDRGNSMSVATHEDYATHEITMIRLENTNTSEPNYVSVRTQDGDGLHPVVDMATYGSLTREDFSNDDRYFTKQVRKGKLHLYQLFFREHTSGNNTTMYVFAQKLKLCRNF